MSKVGELRPDFELKDNEGQPWRLSDKRGRWSRWSFIRETNTRCTKQMGSMRDRWNDYDHGGGVRGVRGSVESHRIARITTCRTTARG